MKVTIALWHEFLRNSSPEMQKFVLDTTFPPGTDGESEIVEICTAMTASPAPTTWPLLLEALAFLTTSLAAHWSNETLVTVYNTACSFESYPSIFRLSILTSLAEHHFQPALNYLHENILQRFSFPIYEEKSTLSLEEACRLVYISDAWLPELANLLNFPRPSVRQMIATQALPVLWKRHFSIRDTKMIMDQASKYWVSSSEMSGTRSEAVVLLSAAWSHLWAGQEYDEDIRTLLEAILHDANDSLSSNFWIWQAIQWALASGDAGLRKHADSMLRQTVAHASAAAMTCEPWCQLDAFRMLFTVADLVNEVQLHLLEQVRAPLCQLLRERALGITWIMPLLHRYLHTSVVPQRAKHLMWFFKLDPSLLSEFPPSFVEETLFPAVDSNALWGIYSENYLHHGFLDVLSHLMAQCISRGQTLAWLTAYWEGLRALQHDVPAVFALQFWRKGHEQVVSSDSSVRKRAADQRGQSVGDSIWTDALQLLRTKFTTSNLSTEYLSEAGVLLLIFACDYYDSMGCEEHWSVSADYAMMLLFHFYYSDQKTLLPNFHHSNPVVLHWVMSSLPFQRFWQAASLNWDQGKVVFNSCHASSVVSKTLAFLLRDICQPSSEMAAVSLSLPLSIEPLVSWYHQAVLLLPERPYVARQEILEALPWIECLPTLYYQSSGKSESSLANFLQDHALRLLDWLSAASVVLPTEEADWVNMRESWESSENVRMAGEAIFGAWAKREPQSAVHWLQHKLKDLLSTSTLSTTLNASVFAAWIAQLAMGASCLKLTQSFPSCRAAFPAWAEGDGKILLDNVLQVNFPPRSLFSPDFQRAGIVSSLLDSWMQSQWTVIAVLWQMGPERDNEEADVILRTAIDAIENCQKSLAAMCSLIRGCAPVLGQTNNVGEFGEFLEHCWKSLVGDKITFLRHAISYETYLQVALAPVHFENDEKREWINRWLIPSIYNLGEESEGPLRVLVREILPVWRDHLDYCLPPFIVDCACYGPLSNVNELFAPLVEDQQQPLSRQPLTMGDAAMREQVDYSIFSHASNPPLTYGSYALRRDMLLFIHDLPQYSGGLSLSNALLHLAMDTFDGWAPEKVKFATVAQRKQVRMWQVVTLLIGRLLSEENFQSLSACAAFETFLKKYTNSSLHPSIRHFMELCLAGITLRDNQYYLGLLSSSNAWDMSTPSSAILSLVLAGSQSVSFLLRDKEKQEEMRERQLLSSQTERIDTSLRLLLPPLLEKCTLLASHNHHLIRVTTLVALYNLTRLPCFKSVVQDICGIHVWEWVMQIAHSVTTSRECVKELLKIQHRRERFYENMSYEDAFSFPSIVSGQLFAYSLGESIPLEVLRGVQPARKEVTPLSELLISCFIELQAEQNTIREQNLRELESMAEDHGHTNLQRKIDPWAAAETETGDTQHDAALRQNWDRWNRHEIIVVASLLENIPNLGGLARSCEIFRASSLVIRDLRKMSDRVFQQVAVTADKWMPISECSLEDLPSFLEEKKQAGYKLIGLEQATNSVPLQDFTFPEHVVLLLGEERRGIPMEYLRLLDHTIEIPQFGVIRSLNVHVSGAILIWEYVKQRMAIEKS